MFKSRGLVIILTFIIGWIVGSVVIFVLLTHQDDGDGGLIAFVRNTATHLTYPSVLLRQNSPATLIPQHLPEFAHDNSSGMDDFDEKTRIIFDWPLSDDSFSVHNYKNLESLLNSFPHAAFRVFVAGPPEVLQYKHEHLLSVKQFDRFRQAGYDIAVLPMETLFHPKIAAIGMEYQRKWFASCCQPCYDLQCAAKGRPLAPYHLLMYSRLMYLWRKGGIFSDFSFYFLSSISDNVVQQVM